MIPSVGHAQTGKSRQADGAAGDGEWGGGGGTAMGDGNVLETDGSVAARQLSGEMFILKWCVLNVVNFTSSF